mgnify:CR=1 FL=1
MGETVHGDNLGTAGWREFPQEQRGSCVRVMIHPRKETAPPTIHPEEPVMPPIATTLSIRAALAAVAALGGAGITANDASALSLRVKLACASDYYAYCSEHAPESAGVRQCMRTNGLKLTKGCVNALVGAGEVSKDEVARRSASAK